MEAVTIERYLYRAELEDEINKGRLELEFVVDVFRQICSALIAAHSQNVLHLDIKPANIFILSTQDGTQSTKVIDLGLAKILSSETGTTVTRFLGTDKYCSPEHFGGKLTFRSDIYSLGATLLHMLAGVIPFSTSYIQAKIYPNLELPPIPSILINRPDFPQQLDQVVQKALSKNPQDRHNSVESLFNEFEQAISGNATQNQKASTNKEFLNESVELNITSLRNYIEKSEVVQRWAEFLKSLGVNITSIGAISRDVKMAQRANITTINEVDTLLNQAETWEELILDILF